MTTLSILLVSIIVLIVAIIGLLLWAIRITSRMNSMEDWWNEQKG